MTLITFWEPTDLFLQHRHPSYFPPLTDSECNRRIDTNLMDSLPPTPAPKTFTLSTDRLPSLFPPLVLSLSGQNVNLSSVTLLLRWHTTESVLIRKPRPITLLSKQKMVLFMWFIPAFQPWASCSQATSQTFHFKGVLWWPFQDLIASFWLYFQHKQGLFCQKKKH